MTLQQAVFAALGFEHLKVNDISLNIEVIKRKDSRNGHSMRVEVEASAYLGKGSMSQLVKLSVAVMEFTHRSGVSMHDMNSERDKIPRVRFNVGVTDPVLAKQFWELATAE